MRCLIFGHTFNTHAGVGQHKGQQFRICEDCGKTVRADDTETPLPDSFALADQQFEERA